jgi:putative restriction endonuclease
MANLDGSWSHGGKHDILAGAILRDEPSHFTYIYRTLLTAARSEGIGPDRLPDFLGLEQGGEFDLLGQDELSPSTLENAFKDQIAKAAATTTWTEQETERILLAAARVGQHLFAQNVLANCGGRCVFCGLNPGPLGGKRMLVAGHIKPWKDSTSTERLDLRNGLAACPSHDVAFDTGLLTVDASLQVHVSGALADAVRADPLTRQYYGRPPLRDTILLPDQAQLPGPKYLAWHKANIFAA